MKTTHVETHLYAGDGVPDHNGADRCTQCGRPKKVHHLPPAPPEQAAHRGRYGETD